MYSGRPIRILNGKVSASAILNGDVSRSAATDGLLGLLLGSIASGGTGVNLSYEAVFLNRIG
jgi:hypothetical protein